MTELDGDAMKYDDFVAAVYASLRKELGETTVENEHAYGKGRFQHHAVNDAGDMEFIVWVGAGPDRRRSHRAFRWREYVDRPELVAAEVLRMYETISRTS